jgi:hypothetical protein
MDLEKVKKEAESNNLPIDDIKADSDTNQYNSEYEPDNFVTELIYLTKKDNSVWCSKSTINAWVKKIFNTEYSLYPISHATYILSSSADLYSSGGSTVTCIKIKNGVTSYPSCTIGSNSITFEGLSPNNTQYYTLWAFE